MHLGVGDMHDGPLVSFLLQRALQERREEEEELDEARRELRALLAVPCAATLGRAGGATPSVHGGDRCGAQKEEEEEEEEKDSSNFLTLLALPCSSSTSAVA